MKIWNVLVNNYLGLIFSLFTAKRETEKLATADKTAKIMIFPLNKNNSLRSNRFLFLTLQTHNFLTLFIRGGKQTTLTKNFEEIKIFQIVNFY